MKCANKDDINTIIEEIYARLTLLKYEYGVCRYLAEVGKAVAEQMLEELKITSNWIKKRYP